MMVGYLIYIYTYIKFSVAVFRYSLPYGFTSEILVLRTTVINIFKFNVVIIFKYLFIKIFKKL